MAAAGLTRLCRNDMSRAAVANITRALYKEALLRAAVNLLFPVAQVTAVTPMAKFNGRRGVLEATVTDPAARAVIAVLLRAGDVPSSACYSRLVGLLDDGNLRMDYFGASRQTDANHRVTGTDVTYAKAGPLDGRILLIPDPMGATGSSVVKVLKDGYGEEADKALAIAVLHLIMAPEYIRTLREEYPRIHIFALRVDRGMSDQEVQDSIPGTFPDREFGLTETQYIAPGAGDMGFRLTGVP